MPASGRLPALAADRWSTLKVDVIVAVPDAGDRRGARAATSKIPIVFNGGATDDRHW